MGSPQLVIWNSPHVGPSPILWNQSRLPKELPGSLNLLVLLLSRQSARFTLPPSLSFVVISSEAKEGLFLSLPVSPPVLSPLSTTAERFSCRTEAFIKLHTQKHPKGLFKPVILNHVFVFRERINAFKNTHTHKSAPMAFMWQLFPKSKWQKNWAMLHKSGLYSVFQRAPGWRVW